MIGPSDNVFPGPAVALDGPALTCCPFLVFALHLPPVVSMLQPPLCGTRSDLTFATIPLHLPFVAFLKLTASSRLSAPLSGSPKCLRFGLWLTVCTLCSVHTKHLLTYLLTYCSCQRTYSRLGWVSCVHSRTHRHTKVKTVYRPVSLRSVGGYNHPGHERIVRFVADRR